MEQLILERNSKTQETQKRVMLVKRTRNLIWLTFVFLGINCAIVNGILATAGGKIKADLHMMDLEYSLFLSFYGVGRMVGAFFLFSVINVANRKYLLIFAAVIKSIAIFTFTATTSFPLCMLSRLFTGLGNAIVSGYLGAWVNQYGSPKWKQFMMAFITFATPLGRSYGLMFEMYFGGPSMWKVGMRINSLCLLIIGIIIMCFPSIYFSNKLVSQPSENANISQSKIETYSVFNVRQSAADERNLNVKTQFNLLCTNGTYFFLLLTRLTIALINASFIFGLPGFIASNYPEAPKQIRLWMYSLFIVTGPFIGSNIGAFLTKKVGGYEKKWTFVIVLIADILVGVFILPMTFLKSWKVFLFNFYGYLIFAAAVLPNLTGIILSSIPASMKLKGAALANLMTSAFGGFLAPIVFGTVNANHAATDKKYVMKFMACYAFIGAFSMLIGTIIRFCKSDEVQQPIKSEVPIQPPKADALHNDDIQLESINAEVPEKDENEKEFESKI